MRKGKISNASNSIAETSDSAYNSDNIDAISVKGIENCAYFGAGTNKVAKKLGTFRNNAYLCTQNNGRVPFIGIGVSPIGRVVRFVATLFLYTKRTVPFFVCTIKMLRITNTFSKKSCFVHTLIQTNDSYDR